MVIVFEVCGNAFIGWRIVGICRPEHREEMEAMIRREYSACNVRASEQSLPYYRSGV